MLKVEKYQEMDNKQEDFIILTKESLTEPNFNNQNYKWLLDKSNKHILIMTGTGERKLIISEDKTYVLSIADNGSVVTYFNTYEEFRKSYRRVSEIPPVSPEFTCRRPMSSEEIQNADIAVYAVDTVLPGIGKPITIFKLREYYHTVSEHGNLYYVLGRKTKDEIQNMFPCEIKPYHGMLSAIWTVRIEVDNSYRDCNQYDESLDGYRSMGYRYKGIICRNGKDFYSFLSGTDINICFQKAMLYINEFNDEHIWGSFNDIDWKDKMIGRHVKFTPMPELDLVVERFIQSQLCVILTLPDGTDPTYRDIYSGMLLTESIKILYNSRNLDWFTNRNISE